MKNNLTPNYLYTLIPTQVQNRYALRNADDIPHISCRTQLYSNSFLPSAIREWNTLPAEIRNSASLSIFKYRMNKNTSKPTPLFNIGNRRDQILHARLRLACSSLNYDLYRKSIVDSPLCSCGSQETVDHYLTSCTKYEPQRQQYLAGLECPVTTDNLLNGNEHLSFEQNKHVFLQVHKFIIATRRF